MVRLRFGLCFIVGSSAFMSPSGNVNPHYSYQSSSSSASLLALPSKSPTTSTSPSSSFSSHLFTSSYSGNVSSFSYIFFLISFSMATSGDLSAERANECLKGRSTPHFQPKMPSLKILPWFPSDANQSQQAIYSFTAAHDRSRFPFP